MAAEPVWLLRAVIEAVHDRLIIDHGGLSGIRDEALLDSALARPRQALAYGAPDLFDLAAAYALGIARNHPFVDGNKRTAFMAAYVFLARNGHRLAMDEGETVVMMIRAAEGSLDEGDLADWFRRNSEQSA